jgi:hypothetical protein
MGSTHAVYDCLMSDSFDEELYSEVEGWLPCKVVRPNEMLHPYGMGPDLAALIMRSLRWLGDADQGGSHTGSSDLAFALMSPTRDTRSPSRVSPFRRRDDFLPRVQTPSKRDLFFGAAA